MIEQIDKWLAFVGWNHAHVLAILYAAGAATVMAWVIKYPLRLYTERKGYPLAAFKWAVRTLTGLGAMLAAWLVWPERGRLAFLGGLAAWVIVLTLYKLTGPILARFAPWISSDHIAQLKAVPDDDESGV